ncbi:MAG: ABC transporter ATP-binding protein [Desulfobacterales bacterium]
MSNQEIIRLEKICHIYNNGKINIHALMEISLTINQGEFVSIAGPSGSGKSTMLHIIGCLMRPTSGSYQLFGKETSRLDKNALAKIRNKTFGFVFQNFNLLPRARAVQNVTLPLVYAGMRSRERISRAKELLHQVGLGNRLSHRPNELSGGEQQRVAIARALVNRPDIIIADEPTGNLDSTSGKSILSLFEKLVEENITVMLVSHDRDIVSQTSRQIMLRDNRLVS